MRAAILRFLLAVSCCAALSAGAVAASAPHGGTGLKLPRFASLRADRVNLRSGPGLRYPVEWVFVFRNMPVEIIGEFENWRKVRDWEGVEGWVHRSMLSGRRWAIVRGARHAMRREPEADAPMVARVDPRAIGRILECRTAWCRLDFAGRQGWMKRSGFWGVYPNETVK